MNSQYYWERINYAQFFFSHSKTDDSVRKRKGQRVSNWAILLQSTTIIRGREWESLSTSGISSKATKTRAANEMNACETSVKNAKVQASLSCYDLETGHGH